MNNWDLPVIKSSTDLFRDFDRGIPDGLSQGCWVIESHGQCGLLHVQVMPYKYLTT